MIRNVKLTWLHQPERASLHLPNTVVQMRSNLSLKRILQQISKCVKAADILVALVSDVSVLHGVIDYTTSTLLWIYSRCHRTSTE